MPSSLQQGDVDLTVARRPAFHRRTVLRDRRPRAVRRHTKRVATRFAVLLVGDFVAIMLARWVATLLADTYSTGAAAIRASALLADPKHFSFLLIATLGSLFATGSHSRHRALNQPARLFVACLLAPLPGVAAAFFHFGKFPPAGPVALTVLLLWLTVLTVRQLSEWVLRNVWPKQRGAGAAIVVGRPEGEGSVFAGAIGAPGGDFAIAGYVSPGEQSSATLGTLDMLPEIIDRHDVEAVVVCGELPSRQMNTLVEDCLQAGCQLLYPARAISVQGVRPSLVWHHDQPFLEIGSPVLKARALISKRIVDVIGSVVLLGLLGPILLLVAIAIRLDSPGPALFFQERAGLGGRRFRMIKFRTMYAGADSEKSELAHLNHTGDPRLFKIRSDPRCTRLGSFLRRWSIDECPQLINVLLGDMSLVGPRPFFESDFASYEDHHFRRLDAKPGITGLWQVSGRSELPDFEDVIYLDRQYIEQWSFWLDISIMFRTVPAVLRRTGAY